MQRTLLDEPARLDFAAEALALRFPKDPPGTVTPSDVLRAPRPEDDGNDLWKTYNVLQEALIRGGIVRRSATDRLTRSRRIYGIRQDVGLNSALWDLAMVRAA